MDGFFGKFNLYELFRILLPGAYFVYCACDFLKYFNLLSNAPDNVYIATLVTFVFSLIAGSLIYALDLCRLFKNCITLLPTKLLEYYYREDFPVDSERLNEHKYYSWYEESKIGNKARVELQSGLYHLSINIAFAALIGIVEGVIICCLFSNNFLLLSNLSLFLLSGLSAFAIVNRRLKWNWQRNYWDYEKILKKKFKIKLKVRILAGPHPPVPFLRRRGFTYLYYYKCLYYKK